MKWIRIVLTMVIALSLASCHKKQESRLSAAVPIPPYAFLLNRIAGPALPVTTLIPPGMEPHDFEPTPRQITELATARIYFEMGMPFEDAMMPKLISANAGLDVVDLRSGITLRKTDEPLLEAGHGEGEHEHEHEGPDPHIWLSPSLLIRQARTMADAMKRDNPSLADDYEKNFKILETELTALSDSIRNSLSTLPNRKLLVFHPAWGYFCDEFGLTQIPIEIRGKSPSTRELGQIIDLAKKEGIRVVFAEQQFSTKEAETVARAIGGKVVLLDPMQADVIANLSRIAATIRAEAGR